MIKKGEGSRDPSPFPSLKAEGCLSFVCVCAQKIPALHILKEEKRVLIE